MRHLHVGRKLGVGHEHRKALLRTLTLSLIEHDAIKTTPARAKELRWFADRMVTLAKRGDVASRRRMIRILGSTRTPDSGVNRVRTAINRVYTVLVPRFKDRNGGYTQIFRLARNRPGDNAELCLMRYIPEVDDKKAKGGKTGGGHKGDAKKKPEAKKKMEAAPAKDKSAKKHEARKHEHAQEHENEPPQDKKTKAKKKEKE